MKDFFRIPTYFEMSQITDALRTARIAANLTQDEFAGLLGITQGFYSDIENGRRELPERHYGKLPAGVRTVVVEAALAELHERTDARIRELRKLIE